MNKPVAAGRPLMGRLQLLQLGNRRRLLMRAAMATSSMAQLMIGCPLGGCSCPGSLDVLLGPTR